MVGGEQVIPGQIRNQQAAKQGLTAEVIKKAAVRPAERMPYIQNSSAGVLNDFAEPASVLSAFALNDIASTPTSVDAVLLHTALLQYSNGQVHPQYNGEIGRASCRERVCQYV